MNEEGAMSDKYAGAERRIPPIEGVFDPAFYTPFLAFFALFQLIGYCIRTSAWKGYSGFKQYRLRNLTVCLIHSTISGCWALGFMLVNPSAMFHETLHWYSYKAAHLPILSMGYFVCDAMDMLRHEFSRWTVELLVHHVASLFVFASAVLPHKFLLYAYWALLMEVNSIFLHIRSLMQITSCNISHPRLYFIVQQLNVITFTIFRFAVQAWQIYWGYVHVADFHLFYAGVALLGGSFFLVINVILFIRVLASDGFLGEFGRKHTAINRDAQNSVRILRDTKNS